MYTKLMLVIILGSVAAKHGNNIYLPLVKMENSESSESDSDSSPGAMENIEKMLANISNRLEVSFNLNRTDLATKDDLEVLKRNLIDEISALIAITHKSKPIDCDDILNEGNNETGIYTIYPSSNMKGISVRCEMDTAGGGWTVIQRRVSISDFYKTWVEYATGFGNLRDNFYIGNRFLHSFSHQYRYMLRVDLTSFEGEKAYAEYSDFYIDAAESGYKLHVGGYTGTAGDALAYHNGMKFSTYDQDNDNTSDNCAEKFHGAWWYKSCHHSNLNGKYGSKVFGKGTNWYQWKGHTTSMKTMEMKLRRKFN